MCHVVKYNLTDNNIYVSRSKELRATSVDAEQNEKTHVNYYIYSNLIIM